MVKFKPLNPITNEFKDWFLNKYNIKLCKLYYAPYNFDRTGCRLCPFALDLLGGKNTLQKLLPHEYKSAEYVFKPILDEYKRIGYRLKSEEQMTIDDFI
jgi:3'-phosphoadenosine 5'-phosphosulfate sulfotransferase (PAPS reductase)/FAD synthetase